MGNPLEKILEVIDFEMFRSLLETQMPNHHKKNHAGAKAFDVVMMFKILILPRYYGLGDSQIEYQILDRISFKSFLGLSSGDKVPDEKAVWAFRESLTNKGVMEKLFAAFTDFLESNGFLMSEGKIIDAGFTVASLQRNIREENKQIRAGHGDELWKDKPSRKRRKDMDARWTKKNGERFYGYKDHAKADARSKLVETHVVTNASVHDSQPLDDLLTDGDKKRNLYADSACSGEKQENVIKKTSDE
ncbi:hypothetical protein EZS27_007528 [termite gut metagenome]|uniref:Transposase InsH N-terminal domain-containing protein n=1 Tax=termite gut metagenome TaxID=433724 RepID=A0A5J4SGF2_9ZZZZ